MQPPVKIALVSTMYSPFQVALADALNARDDVACDALFTMTRSGARGKHWTAGMKPSSYIHVAPEWQDQHTLTRWIGDQFQRSQPDIVLTTGILRSNSFRATFALRNTIKDTPIGLWLEHPNFAVSTPQRLIMKAAIRAQLRTVDYVLAIGDKAQAFYQRCHPREDGAGFHQ